MLLRVDAFPNAPSPSQQQQHPSNLPPLHACLATASHHAPDAPDGAGTGKRGVLLTAGRKGCDANFDSDKSVSRKHCAVRLISKFAEPPGSTPPPPGDGDDEGGEKGEEEEDARVQAEPDAPRTDEERNACDASPDGTICVVDDLGSRFGTLVVFVCGSEEEERAKALAAARGKKNGDDSATDDDATDDEAPMGGGLGGGGSSQATTTKMWPDEVELNPTQLHAVRLALGDDLAASSSAAPTLRARRVQAKGSLLLPPLSTLPGPGGGVGGKVVILLGQYGSALRLMRLPLRFTLSRIDSGTKKRLVSIAPLLGGSASSGLWDDEFASTHLVTPKTMSTAKALAAWSSSKPIVEPSYVEALMARTKPSDPLPDDNEYRPEGSLPMDSFVEDETTVPRNQLLGRYHVVTLIDDDTGAMVRAAGALVTSTFAMDDETFFDPKWIDDLERSCSEEERRAWVVVDSHSKRVKKRRDFLAKRGASGDGSVRFINPKAAALAISERAKLKDLDGEEVVPPPLPTPPPEEEEKKKKKATAMEEQTEQPQEEKGEGDDAEAMQVDGSAAPADAADRSENERAAALPPTVEESVVTKGDESGKNDRAAAAASAAERDEEEQQPFPDGGHDDDDGAAAPEPEAAMAMADEEPPTEREKQPKDGGARPASSQQQKQPSASASAAATKRKRDDEEEEAVDAQGGGSKKNGNSGSRPPVSKKPRNPSERMHLPQTSDGWFVAAPKNPALRAQYRSTSRDLEGRDDADLFLTAASAKKEATESRPDLVVRSEEEVRSRQEAVRQARLGAQSRLGRRRGGAPSSSGPDFKKFRKNDVVMGSTLHALRPVRLRSVLPKESERQRQLELTQEELDREQRVADALFNDGGAGGGGRGRKKSGGGGGSIRQFFRQGQPSQGQNRRRSAAGGRRRI